MLSVGTVKWFSTRLGYGFIEGKHGEDIFVHFSAIQSFGYRNLDCGQKVSYQRSRGKNGPTAINVTPLM